MAEYADALFVDHHRAFPEMKANVAKELWELCRKQPVLKRLDFGLVVKTGESLDRSSSVFQAVDALIKLRNGLVHFKPESFSEQQEHAKISKLLAGKIENSRFLQAESLFPRAWASGSCTSWAVKSVANFVIDFEQRAGLNRLGGALGKVVP